MGILRRLGALIADGWGLFLDSLYPTDLMCVLCGAELNKDRLHCVCARCTGALPYVGQHYCLRCGAAIDNLSDYCQYCKRTKRHFDLARCVMAYEGSIAAAVKRFKGGHRYLAPYFAQFLIDYYPSMDIAPDICTVVPIHPRRLRQRGFNQALQLAAPLCQHYQLPLVQDCLVRSSYASKQALLHAAQRQLNIKNVFAVNPLRAHLLNNKSVLLIDDVATTRSTLDECSRILKDNGAAAVFCLTLTGTRGK